MSFAFLLLSEESGGGVVTANPLSVSISQVVQAVSIAAVTVSVAISSTAQAVTVSQSSIAVEVSRENIATAIETVPDNSIGQPIGMLLTVTRAG